MRVKRRVLKKWRNRQAREANLRFKRAGSTARYRQLSRQEMASALSHGSVGFYSNVVIHQEPRQRRTPSPPRP